MTSALANRTRESLADQAANEILELIIDEDLQPGASLPSESQLAATLDVSRVVVREACRTLAARGIVTIKQGRGMFVNPWSPEQFGMYFDFALRRNAKLFEDLLEVRLTIEVQAAGLAARNRTTEDLAGMGDALEAMGAAGDDFEKLATADVDFHDAVFRASGNDVLAFLGAGLGSLLLDSRRLTNAGSAFRGEGARPAYADHKRILDAIDAGERAKAERAMAEHMHETRERLIAAYEGLPASQPNRLGTREIVALAREETKK